MKLRIKIAVIAVFGMCLGVNAQWNTNGNNSTTGSVQAGQFVLTSGDGKSGFYIQKPESSDDPFKITMGSQTIKGGIMIGREDWNSKVMIPWNVGIGTNDPKGKLDVNGSYFSRGREVMVSDGLSSYMKTAGNIYFENSNAVLATMLNNGNLGIGTTSPNAKLDVNGIIQAGDNNATKGGVFLAQKYGGNDYIGTLSSNYSSGALILGYGAAGMKNQGASGHLVSTFDNFSSHRGALRIGKGTLEFLSTPSAVQTTVDSELSVKSRFYVDNNGDVGIGTTDPGAKIDLLTDLTSFESFLQAKTKDAPEDYFALKNATGANGQFIPNLIGRHTSDNRSALYLSGWIKEGNDQGDNPIMTFDSRIEGKPAINRPLFGWDSHGQRRMTLLANGDLGIGTANTKGFKLGVKGKIAAEEVKVAAFSNWSDFVFYENYDLPTLTEVENHIKEKGHLKDIPSAEEVAKDGFYLGAMDARLLQKIEELTLYTIEQQKEIEQLKKENSEVKQLNQKLLEVYKRLEKLENQ